MAVPAEILPRHSVEEYLALEDRSDVRHEYVAGFMHAMAGETERHNLLVLNIAFLLRAVAGGRSCRVVTENVKLHIAASNKFYYPDVMVLCEPGDDHPSIKRQPCFIAEVLSPSTEATDRREKLEAYRTVPALQTYAIVDPQRRYVEVHQRADGIWRAVAVQGDSVVVVPCLDTSLSLDGMYEGLAPVPDRRMPLSAGLKRKAAPNSGAGPGRSHTQRDLRRRTPNTASTPARAKMPESVSLPRRGPTLQPAPPSSAAGALG